MELKTVGFLVFTLVVAVRGGYNDFVCTFSSAADCSYTTATGEDYYQWQTVYANTQTGAELGLYSDTSAALGGYAFVSQDEATEVDEYEARSDLSSTYDYGMNFGSLHCLRFNYRMFGPSVGQLRVQLVGGETDETQTVNVFDKSGNQGPDWYTAQITIDIISIMSYFPYLNFEATRGVTGQGEIAVTQVQWDLNQCGTTLSVTCSFTSGDTCGYDYLRDSGSGWITVLTQDYSPGPLTDHTTGTEYGGYAYVRLETDDVNFVMYSPTDTSQVIPMNSPKCLGFYYMLGDGAALSISSLGAMSLGAPMDLYWESLTYDPRDTWLYAELSVYDRDWDTVLVFTAGKETDDADTYLALDDVVIRDGYCLDNVNMYFETGLGTYRSDLELPYEWIVLSSGDSSALTLDYMADHTTESTGGHVAVALFKGQQKDNRAALSSPIFLHAEIACLSLSYYFSHAGQGALLVQYQSSDGRVGPTIGNFTTQLAGQWITEKIRMVDYALNEESSFVVVFEAWAGDNQDAFIALDDVIVTELTCLEPSEEANFSVIDLDFPESEYDCDFEDGTICQWSYYADTTVGLEVSVVSENPGPEDATTDHTGNSQTHVLRTQTAYPEPGTTYLTSPELPGQTDGNCLTFWYWVHDVYTYLEVQTSDPTEVEGPVTVFIRGGDTGIDWQYAEINIYREQDFQISIVFIKTYEDGSILVDDIRYSSSACPTASLGFDDTCDFETGDCEFTSNIAWQLYTGQPAADYLWTGYDHTYQTTEGHFMLLDQHDGTSSVLTSPPIFVEDDDVYGLWVCARFNYFLHGDEVGVLELLMQKPLGEEVLWSAAGEHSQMWLHTQVDIYAEETFSMAFRVISDYGLEGVVGVDDITLRRGRCLEAGACNFNNDMCSWYPDFTPSWDMNYEEHRIEFRGGDYKSTGMLGSEVLEADQVRCLSFTFGYTKGTVGPISLTLNTIDGENQDLLWLLDISTESSYGDTDPNDDSLVWVPAQVTVDSSEVYQLVYYAGANSENSTFLIDYITFYDNECLAKPEDAVSYNCDFSDGFCFWQQGYQDNVNFAITSVNGELFAWLLASLQEDSDVYMTARLRSPLIPAGERCFQFEYYLSGSNVDSLNVYLDKGYDKTTLTSWTGVSSDWQLAALDLVSDTNFRIEIEANCNPGTSCEIYVGPLTLPVSTCADTWQTDSGEYFCSFEDTAEPLCQWEVKPAANSTYTWKSSGGSSNPDPEAPADDNTLGPSGHYAYVAPPENGPLNPGTLSTTLTSGTIYQDDGAFCLSFAYYLEYSYSGTLNLHQLWPDESPFEPIWSATVSDAAWRPMFVYLGSMTDFQLVFEAVADSGTVKGLAVDDILLSPGPCMELTDTCNFTDGFCRWSNEQLDGSTFVFDRRNGETNATLGPLQDHSDPATQGYYIIASTEDGENGDQTGLISEIISLGMDSASMCVNFFYYMSGVGSPTLDVNIIRGYEEEGDRTSLKVWELTADATTTEEWVEGNVNIDEKYTTELFQIEFVASVEDGSSISLDDITISMSVCSTDPAVQSIPLDLILSDISCTFDVGELLCGWENFNQTDPLNQWKIATVDDLLSDPSFTPLYSNPEEGESVIYTSTEQADDDVEHMAMLLSPTLPPSEGVDCLSFWYYIEDNFPENLVLSLYIDGQTTDLWMAEKSYVWDEAKVDIYWDHYFQISIKSIVPVDEKKHVIDSIVISSGSCVKPDVCDFEGTFCGYQQDDSNNFDWTLATLEDNQEAMQPYIDGTVIGDIGRVVSPVYGGGGEECFKFQYRWTSTVAGNFSVYTPLVGDTELGSPLWIMPNVLTLDVSTTRDAAIEMDIDSPFQIVFEYVVTSDGVDSIPSMLSVEMKTHACPGQGWCDFEEDFCSYVSDGWTRFTPQGTVDGTKYVTTDHTLGSAYGYYAAVDLSAFDGTAVLESTILDLDQSSCLTFAYVSVGAAQLQVHVLDDSGITFDTFTDTPIDTVDAADTLVWQVVTIEASAISDYWLIRFEATATDDGAAYSAVFLDDIQLVGGACNEQTTPSPVVEEALGVIGGMSCDFEDTQDAFCDFLQTDENNAYWQRTYGSYNSSGLDHDHTTESENGAYAAMLSIADNAEAYAALEVIFTTASSQEIPHCVSFWYYIVGHPLNSLAVYLEEDPLWQVYGETGLDWQHATVDLGIDATEITSMGIFSVKFAGFLVSRDGQISLDDIETYNGSCPVSETCEFEGDGQCGYTPEIYEDSSWTRMMAGDVTVDTITQPIVDHTYGTTLGHFMYGYADVFSVLLTSPVYDAPVDARCLTFWYQLGSGSLTVYTQDREGSQTQLYTLDPTAGDGTWAISRANIQARSDFQVVFELAPSTDPVYAFVDDIQVSQDACHELYDCDFEEDMCTWTEMPDISNTEWVLQSGVPPAGQQVLGPRADHTTGTAEGQYVIVQGADESTTADTSMLKSMEVFVQGDSCLTFWYYLESPRAGYIQAMFSGETWYLLSEPMLETDVDWVYGQIDVADMGTGFVIYIYGTTQPGSTNYLALDDLILLDYSCPTVASDAFSCNNDEQTVIQDSQVCDFVTDCSNNADERACGICDFDTSWCQFQNEDVNNEGWIRQESDDGNGYFLSLSSLIEASFSTTGWFQRSPPGCRSTFQVYLSQGLYDTLGLSDYLTVSIRTNTESVPTYVYLEDPDADSVDVWMQAYAFLGNIMEPFQLVFDGNRQNSAIMGIDNMMMVNCSYPDPAQSCADGLFQCADTGCIEDYKVCDFSLDCADGSDESNCDNARTDFEGSFGDWTAYQTGDLWTIVTAASDTEFMRDHSPSAIQGSYAYPERDASDTAATSYSYLLSPVLVGNTDCQVSFFYMNTDSATHEIHVYTKLATSESLEDVSFVTMEQGPWVRVLADLMVADAYQVVIEGVNILGVWVGDYNLALDDVSLSNSCQVSSDQTAVATITKFEVTLPTGVTIQAATTVEQLTSTEGVGETTSTERVERTTVGFEIITGELPEQETSQSVQRGETTRATDDVDTYIDDDDSEDDDDDDDSADSNTSFVIPLVVGLVLAFIAIGSVAWFICLRSNLVKSPFRKGHKRMRQLSYVNEMFDYRHTVKNVQEEPPEEEVEADLTLSQM